MRDIPYTSKLDHAEDGRPLALDYFILVRDGEPEQYGIKVIEKNDGVNIYEAGQRVRVVMDPRDVMAYPAAAQQ